MHDPSQVPLSLYVHIPWCVRKCPYCDFNSHELTSAALPETAYVDALLADLDYDLATRERRPAASVFIGGGTPSLLSGASLARLLEGIDERLALSADVEITIEANPGTAEQGRFCDYRAAGVNRISIGVQSFDDRALAALGRIHDGRESRAAVTAARRAGFESVNIDLMYGLPGQTSQEAVRDVRVACGLDVTHLSHYQLTLEPNTLFHRYPPSLPDEDDCWEMLRASQSVLHDSGYTQYEVSAYAQAGFRCRHNLNYWMFGDYLGIGAGAHGKWTGKTVNRLWKQRQPRRYLSTAGTDSGTAGSRSLAREELVFEFMLNALRLSDGFEEGLLTERTSVPLSQVEPVLREAETRGLLWRGGGRLGPTALGQRFLNDLVTLFCSDADSND